MRVRIWLEIAILVALSVVIALWTYKEGLAIFTQVLLTALLSLALSHLLTPELNAWLFKGSQVVLRRLKDKQSKEVPRPHQSDSVPEGVKSGLKSFGSLPSAGAQLWVVASGKGGVGKSLISLGLAESLSRRRPTLLLDFDLHNRGLTSLLEGIGKSDDSAFSLLDEFRQMIASSSGNSGLNLGELLHATSALPEGFAKESFNTLVEKFAREIRSEAGAWENLQKYNSIEPKLGRISIETDDIPVDGENVSLHPKNSFFLPSRQDKEGLLLSEVSTSSYVLVFLFLRALCRWLKQEVDVIVLDCHGAHDMFTVGSILAADKLVVVTTTDPGSYNGTAELLDFVKTLKDERASEVDTAVVLNNCSTWDEHIGRAERMYSAKALRARGFVCIAEDDRIREMMSTYSFGLISRHRRLWGSIRTITELLEGHREPSISEAAGKHSPDSTANESVRESVSRISDSAQQQVSSE